MIIGNKKSSQRQDVSNSVLMETKPEPMREVRDNLNKSYSQNKNHDSRSLSHKGHGVQKHNGCNDKPSHYLN